MNNKFEKLYPSASFLKTNETEDGHVANFRLKCATVDEFKKWLKHHQQLSGVIYRVQTTTPCTGQKVIYKAYYRCQHNTYPDSHKTKSPSSKHTDCKAKLKISIQSTSTKNIKSKDKLRIEFPSIVEVHFTHNHDLLVAEALKFKDVGNECKEKFLGLFKSHRGPAKALELHKQNLMEQYNDEYYIEAADTPISPDINWVHNTMLEIEFDESNDVLSTVDDCNTNSIEIIAHQPSVSTLNIDQFKQETISMTQLLQKKIENDFENNPTAYRSAVRAMTKQIQSMKSQDELLSAMRSFGKRNVVPRKRVGNIPVKPTSVGRRGNKHFTRRSAPQGRQAKTKTAEHIYAKKEKC